MNNSNGILDIRPFSYESGQDVTIFLKRFEKTVDARLAADATAAQKKAEYLRLLPTKLDDFSLTVFESSDNNTDWAAIKDELITKFSDPMKIIVPESEAIIVPKLMISNTCHLDYFLCI